jgi:hypothetical protein
MPFTAAVQSSAPRPRSPVDGLLLSLQQYSVLLNGLRQAALTGGSERREHNRVEVQAPVRVALLTADEDGVMRLYTALSRDLSVGGVGLTQFFAVEKSQRLLVRLPFGGNDLAVICRPAFCRPVAEGLFAVGCAFERSVSPAQAAKIEASGPGAKLQVATATPA